MTEPEPTDSATFEVRRLTRRRTRSPIVAFAWGAALLALVGVGLFGRAFGGDQPSARDAVAGILDPVLEASPGGLVVIDAIDLQAPPSGPIVVTTPGVSIRGASLLRADHVVIALEARNNRVLEQTIVNVADTSGDFRPDYSPTFEATFALPYPRPNDTMWVVVTAIDSRGVPLGGIRRPFIVGRITPPRQLDSSPWDDVVG